MNNSTLKAVDLLTQRLIRQRVISDPHLFNDLIVFLLKIDLDQLRLIEQQLVLLKGYVVPERERNREDWLLWVGTVVRNRTEGDLN